jgi:hypothetical protein
MLKDLDGKRRLVSTVDGLESSAIKPLPVMRELTELLPNDAWLTLLSFDAKGVELTGQANAASALIPLLENSLRFERVEFASPVTRGRDREQFRIHAAWEARATAPTPARTAVTPAAPPAPPMGRLPRATAPAPPPAAAPAPVPPQSVPPQVTAPDQPSAGGTLPPQPRRPIPLEGNR